MISEGIDHYSYLIDRRHRPLLLGIIFLLLAIAMMVTGQSWERFGPTVTRWENPDRFWRSVAVFIVSGLIGIGFFLYQNSN
jgi:uncharacterized membrane protein